MYPALGQRTFHFVNQDRIMNEMEVSEDVLLSKIYVLRGSKVMLDSDLSELYQVETKRLNEQVKRNVAHSPEDFMFQLTEEE